MAAIATAPRTDAPEIVLPTPVRAFMACDRCDNLETPGLTYLTPWGLLCGLCHDAYASAHDTGEGDC
jgi:hypothetical protein